MSVFLRWENADYPLFRVLYATTFGADGSGPWTEATYWTASIPNPPSTRTATNNGIFFDECSRQVLPGIGDALLTMDYGIIDAQLVEPYDLIGKHIRIQAARRPVGPASTVWRTIWVGRCEWQEDQIDAGAATPRGRRSYRCVDLLRSYLCAYPMDRHANYLLTGALGYGHPGYNYDKSQPDVAVGNRESTGSGYAGPDSTTILNFGIDDASAGKTLTTWTDAQALSNVMLLRRNAGDPIFDVDDPAGLLGEATAIPVKETDMAWDVVTRICDRRRGKGLAYLDWEDDSANPTGALDVKLRIRPQLFSTLTYTYPAGTVVNIPGAQDTGSACFVDVQNDHRLVDGSITLRSTEDSAIDALVTEGERIEVAVTASGDDGTIVARWPASLESAYTAADDDGKKEEKFRPVLQRFGLARTAGLSFKNGDGGASARADYWTDADGLLSITHTTVTAPAMIEVMDDLPLYEGYDYSVTPPVPAASATKDGKPRRAKPKVYVRYNTNRFQMPGEFNEGGAQLSVDDDGIWVEWAGDEPSRDAEGNGGGGGRVIRDLDGSVDENALTFVLGLRMPQRPRFATQISGTVRRRRTIQASDMHLWIAHAGCIWDLDRSTQNDDGCNAKRIGGTIGSIGGKILRDDREKLARIHYLSWEWYRSDVGRRGVSWAIKDCGLLPTWTDLAGQARTYPKLGQVIDTLTGNGTTYTIRTPISRVEYNNRDGVTTWQSDWMEFDYGAA